ncbi:MAG: hypothetical protein ACPGGD_03135 [Thalassolituus sp.]
MSEVNELNELLVCGDGELMPRPEDIKHDEQTLSLYQDYVSAECTCGYHSPPPGLCENPMAHIEYCAFRTNRLRNANNIGQSLIAH